MSVVALEPDADAPAPDAARSRQGPVPPRLEKRGLRTALRTRLPDRLFLEARDGERRQREIGASRRGLVDAVIRSLPGPAPDDQLVVAICNCLEPHPERPDGKVGCGSYGALTLRWPRPAPTGASRAAPPPRARSSKAPDPDIRSS